MARKRNTNFSKIDGWELVEMLEGKKSLQVNDSLYLKQGVDFDQTYSSTVKMLTLRILLSSAVQEEGS